MNDFSKFINWYFGARTRMGRATFNIVFLFATLPVFMLSMQGVSEDVSKLSQQGINMGGAIESLMDGFSGANLSKDPEELARQMGDRAKDLQGLAHYDWAGTSQQKEGSSIKEYAKNLDLLIYILMIPLVRMRLRDGGHVYGLGHWGILFAAYLVPAMEAARLLHFHVGSTENLLGQALSFLAFIWLCTKKTERRGSQREGYLPGDSPDDPY